MSYSCWTEVAKLIYKNKTKRNCVGCIGWGELGTIEQSAHVLAYLYGERKIKIEVRHRLLDLVKKLMMDC